MMLYAVAVVGHVLIAVLAVGLVGAIPLTARLARASDGAMAGIEKVLGALLRAVQVGLVVTLLTGGLLDLSAAGAFHRTAWFQVAIALFVILGGALGRARAALRRGFAPGGLRENALAHVERWGWTMCALVAVIVTLMQLKPFP
jgi:hypothetical protein